MSRSLSLLAATLPILLSIATPVSAQQRTPADEHKVMLRERLKVADTNKDGLIDCDEAQAKLPRLAKRFDAIDADGDGKLSSDELRAAGQKMTNRRGR